MDVYQLMPTPCYDDDEDVDRGYEFWEDEATLDADGRSSRNGFYAADPGRDAGAAA